MTDTPLTTAAFNRMAEYIKNYHDGSKPEGPDKKEFFAETIQQCLWDGLHLGSADASNARLAETVEELAQELRNYGDPSVGILVGDPDDGFIHDDIELGNGDEPAREFVLRRYGEEVDKFLALAHD